MRTDRLRGLAGDENRMAKPDGYEICVVAMIA
jgi:hypothetical protein